MTDTFGDGWNGAEYALIALPALDTLATGTMASGSEEIVNLCTPEGCFRFTVGSGAFASEVGWSLTVNGVEVGAGGAGDQAFFGTAGQDCSGCADATACNYDPADQGISDCTYPGCGDEAACNYDSAAPCSDLAVCEYPDSDLVDCDGTCINDADNDGICDEEDTDGCTYAQACNYNPSALDDDGSCVFPGCIYPAAVNFDPTAACDDGSCLFGGCMYAGAVNYDGEADVDDGSCVFDVNLLCPSDVNNDGNVDALDILAMLPNYGAVCGEE